MKKTLGLVPILIFILASCKPIASGPQVWFDKPMTGTLYDFPVLNPVDLLVHASDPSGIKQVEVFVNGTSYVVLPGAGAGESLTQYPTSWSPPEPGKYTVQARALGNTGVLSGLATTVLIFIDPAERGQPSPTMARTRIPSVTPTVTLSPTFRITLTRTITPTLTWTATVRFVSPTSTVTPTRIIPPTETPEPTQYIPPTVTPTPTREIPPTYTPTPTPTRYIRPTDTPLPTRYIPPTPTPRR